jgi:hypothetical protein
VNCIDEEYSMRMVRTRQRVANARENCFGLGLTSASLRPAFRDEDMDVNFLTQYKATTSVYRKLEAIGF